MYVTKIGQRVEELKIEPIEKKIVDKYLSSKHSKGIIYFGKTQFIFLVTGLIGLTNILLYSIGYFLTNIDNFKLNIIGLVSLSLVTGLPVFLSKETIEKIEKKTLWLIEVIIDTVKDIFKFSIYISDKSISDYKYVYSVVILFIPILVIFSFGFFTKLFGGIETLALSPERLESTNTILNFISEHYSNLILIPIFGIIFLRAIDLDDEIKFFKEGKLISEYKKWIIFNVVVCFAIMAIIYLYLEKNSSKIEGFTDINKHVFFLPLYCFTIYVAVNNILQMLSTSSYLQGKKPTTLFKVQLFLISPFIIFLIIGVQAIPTIIILLFFGILRYIFYICLKSKEISSAYRVLGFIVSFSVLVFKIFQEW